jgi:UDP-glucose 4-epimerase
MTEIMLRNAGAAYGLRHVILRYFNAALADLMIAERRETWPIRTNVLGPS